MESGGECGWAVSGGACCRAGRASRTGVHVGTLWSQVVSAGGQSVAVRVVEQAGPVVRAYTQGQSYGRTRRYVMESGGECGWAVSGGACCRAGRASRTGVHVGTLWSQVVSAGGQSVAVRVVEQAGPVVRAYTSVRYGVRW
ncbi:hypothetical protein ACJJTC_017059 [Scirpophaga incertulas]